MSEPLPSAPKSSLRRHGGRLALFGGVGLVNTVTDFLLYAALVVLGLAPASANAAAFLVANVQSYVVNSRLTFRSAGRAAPISARGYSKFFFAHLLSLAISTAMILAFADKVGPYVAKAGAVVFTFAWNYAASAALVFNRPKEDGVVR